MKTLRKTVKLSKVEWLKVVINKKMLSVLLVLANIIFFIKKIDIYFYGKMYNNSLNQPFKIKNSLIFFFFQKFTS
jgi:type IV secretory pathway VirB6-like protein